MKWYMERVDSEDGEICYEAHEINASDEHSHMDGFVIFHGANAKTHCSRFVEMMNTTISKGEQSK